VELADGPRDIEHCEDLSERGDPVDLLRLDAERLRQTVDVRGSVRAAAGKSSVTSSPTRTVSTPERVWNLTTSSINSSSASAWAVANVACPQRSTSTVGVNYRRSQSPSGRGRANAVSERFSSAATRCIQDASGHRSTTQTPAGFPANARSVKASTTRILTSARIYREPTHYARPHARPVATVNKPSLRGRDECGRSLLPARVLHEQGDLDAVVDV
jgi:hypothetical protein